MPRKLSRYVIILLFAVALVAGSSLSAFAQVQPLSSGSISGIVYAPNGTTPISGATVYAISLLGLPNQQMTTPANGSYSFTVTPGAYYVQAIATSYPDEYYSGGGSGTSAQSIYVASGAVVTGKNIILKTPAVLSGKVFAPNGVTPVSGVPVTAYDRASENYLATTTTDGSGSFTFYLHTVTVRLYAEPAGYPYQYYNDSIDWDTADPISVTQGTTTPNKNFVLDTFGTVSGTIYAADGVTPLANGYVYAADPATFLFRGFTYADGSGHYSLHLRPGTYWIWGSADAHAGIYYNNEVDSSNANPITVAVSSNVTGINFSLPLGSTISGAVSLAGGAPLMPFPADQFPFDQQRMGGTPSESAGSFQAQPPLQPVVVFGADGTPHVIQPPAPPPAPQAPVAAPASAHAQRGVPPLMRGFNPLASPTGAIYGYVEIYNVDFGYLQSEAPLNADGSFSVPGLPGGTYGVGAYVPGYVRDFYAHTSSQSSATPVSVPPGGATSGINFTLDPAGTIFGTVFAANGTTPLPNNYVDFIASGYTLWSACSNDFGQYYLTGVPLNVAVKVRAWGPFDCHGANTNYQDEYWNNSHTVAGATPITLTAASPDSTGINFTMDAAASISGHVQSLSSTPIENAAVQVTNFSNGKDLADVYTDASGNYTAGGLPTGDMRVYVQADNFVPGYYNNTIDHDSATAVHVTLGATTSGINFSLNPGGTITGTVYEPDGVTPLANAQVTVYDPVSFSFTGGTYTDGSGNYTVSTVPPGSYVVLAHHPNYPDEYYNNKTNSADADLVVVTGNNTTSGINLRMETGGVIDGFVYQSGGTIPIPGVTVTASSGSTSEFEGAVTDATGHYHMGLRAASDYVVQANTFDWGNQYYNHKGTFATADQINVTVGSTHSNVNFTLDATGTISGYVTNAVGGAAVGGLFVTPSSDTYDNLFGTCTEPNGFYMLTQVPLNTPIKVMTDGSSYCGTAGPTYNPEWWHDAADTGSATPITLTAASPNPTGVNLTLTQVGGNLLQNGDFSGGLTHWGTFGQITYQIVGGVYQFYRNSGGASAVVLQNTGVALPAGAPLTVALDLGNSSNVRKRAVVLMHEFDFTDLQVCSFWIPPNTPLRTYHITTHTTKAWTAANLSVYASPADGLGYILLDNVHYEYHPELTVDSTLCVDPSAPAPGVGADSANLVTNGDFSGGLTPWGTFGQITYQIAGGMFQFYKTAGTPAGVVLQNTGIPVAGDVPIEAHFQLGNSSNIRMRATILLQAADFSDLQVCTFWIPPNTPLQNYAIRTFSTQAWGGATISVYPATVAASGWILLDNVTVITRPTLSVSGTECYEPGSGVAGAPQGGAQLPPSGPVVLPPVGAPPEIPEVGGQPTGEAPQHVPSGDTGGLDAPPPGQP